MVSKRMITAARREPGADALGFSHELGDRLIHELDARRLQLCPFLFGHLERPAQAEHRQVGGVGAQERRLLQATLPGAKNGYPAVAHLVGVAGRAMAHDAASDCACEVRNRRLHILGTGREEHRMRAMTVCCPSDGKAAVSRRSSASTRPCRIDAP